MAYLEYFPESLIELQKELKNWPMISEEADRLGGGDLGQTLGVIAARLGILLDGVYVPAELADMLVKKLRELRKEIIIDPNYKSPEMVNVQIKEGQNSVTIEQVPTASPKPGVK